MTADREPHAPRTAGVGRWALGVGEGGSFLTPNAQRPTPALCPLEAELEALLEIELTEDLEAPMNSWDQKLRSHLSVAEVNALRKALRNLCLAVEELLEDETTCDLQDHYEAARAALGEPCTLFPGGPEGEHFHFLEFDPEADCCYYCDQHAQAQEAAKAE